jgi:hypothetical protein
MTPERPLYKTRIQCPVCNTPNEFEAIKVGSYNESGRDSDFRPTGRIWRHPEFQDVNPLVYAMATCVSCFYTRELDGNYRNWQRDVTFRMYRQKTLREAHLLALADRNGVLRRLGTHLDVQRFPHATAINKLLLGILDEQIVEGANGLNAARFFLRIAWLFRELGVADESAESHEAVLIGVRRGLQARQVEWQAWLARAQNLAVVLAQEVEQARGAPERLEAIGARTQRLFEEWLAFLEPPEEEPPESPVDHGYFEYASHRDFLSAIRSQWDEVPLSELEALAFALKYYMQFFEQCRSFSSPEQEVQTTYLIGELARRTRQPKLAGDYFNHAIRKGQQLIHEYQTDVQRTTYLRKLVETAIEQGKKNRAETAVEA